MTKLTDPLGVAFMEFLESQGIKFVDADTGKPITAEGMKKKQERHTSTPKGKRIEK